MKKLLIGLGIAGVATFLPIWRGAGHSRHDGVNLWKLLRDSNSQSDDSPFGHPHIKYGEAVQRAHTVYLEVIDNHGS